MDTWKYLFWISIGVLYGHVYDERKNKYIPKLDFMRDPKRKKNRIYKLQCICSFNFNVFFCFIFVRLIVSIVFMRVNEAGSDTQFVNRHAHGVFCANSINKIINHEIVALNVVFVRSHFQKRSLSTWHMKMWQYSLHSKCRMGDSVKSTFSKLLWSH